MTICPEERCTGCGACQSACPADCITLALNRAGDRVAVIDESRCTHCGKCRRICPVLHPPVLRESLRGLRIHRGELEALIPADLPVPPGCRAAEADLQTVMVFLEREVQEG